MEQVVWPDTDSLIVLVNASQGRLESSLRGAALDARASTALAGWSVAHLLTHVARNADSVVRRLEAAHEGRSVEQYPGGRSTRAREIEEGSTRDFAELAADVVATNARVLDASRAIDGPMWQVTSISSGGVVQSAEVVLRRRLIEVELHHVDLGVGYEPAQWPSVVVEQLIAECLERWDDPRGRVDVAAWLTGRGSSPTPPPF